MLAVGLSRWRLSPVAVWLVLVTVLPVSRGFGETFEVPSDRARTISQALSLAQAPENTDSSNTIEVASGTYTETTLAISKSVTIRGKDGAKVVVRAAENILIAIGGTSTVSLANLILTTSGRAIQIDSSANVTLINLVVTRATTAIACPSAGTTTVSIDHVTFFQVTNGIDCRTSNIPIRNNIFSVISGTAIFPLAQGAAQPTYNLFHAVTDIGQEGDNALPNPPENTADDPKFVDSANNDFHLQVGSAAIGAGRSITGTDVDLGAYGGLLIDQVPFPPQNPRVTCGVPDATSCRISWTQNLDHLVTGYLVMTSAPSAPNPDYDQEDPLDNAAALCTGSPPVCSFTRSSLADTGTTPAQPSMPTAGFGDTRVQLTWPAVSGATTYDVFVRTDTTPATLAMTVSSNGAVIEGLTNGVPHYFSVRAVNQPTFHAAVKAVYSDPPASSDVSEAAAVVYGTAQPGPPSAEVTSTPQPVVGFPPLEDAGGCFIATAAYGSALAPQVDTLRAFRERYLRPYAPGRVVIREYEIWSPPLADVIRSSEILRQVVRVVLWPIVGLAWLAVSAPWWLMFLVVGMTTIAVWFVLVRLRGAASA